MAVTVVVPTIREQCAKRFLEEWADDLAGHRLIFVEDNPEPTFDLGSAEHYSWTEIDISLGDYAWIIPRRTSAIRSFGLMLAVKGGADIVWTLDDDCYPEDVWRGRYLSTITARLSQKVTDDSWYNTLPEWCRDPAIYPRGFPYAVRGATQPVMAHHGLWSEHADLDGVTQLANPDFRLTAAQGFRRIPTGAFFPLCIMNFAFRNELVPAMYMLLMGQDDRGRRWGYDRFDDIWAGLFCKKVCDHLGWAIVSGAPSIHHSKASNPEANAKLEAPGIRAHEGFWRYVRDVELTANTVAGCYRELAAAVSKFSGPDEFGRYWRRLGRAMMVWAGLFD